MLQVGYASCCCSYFFVQSKLKTVEKKVNINSLGETKQALRERDEKCLSVLYFRVCVFYMRTWKQLMIVVNSRWTTNMHMHAKKWQSQHTHSLHTASMNSSRLRRWTIRISLCVCVCNSLSATFCFPCRIDWYKNLFLFAALSLSLSLLLSHSSTSSDSICPQSNAYGAR